MTSSTAPVINTIGQRLWCHSWVASAGLLWCGLAWRAWGTPLVWLALAAAGTSVAGIGYLVRCQWRLAAQLSDERVTRAAQSQREALLRAALTDDIEQLHQRHHDDQARVAALRQDADTQRRFVANLNHKLRTPMTAVLGFAQLLSYEHNLADQHRIFVREIETAGQAVLTILNETLAPTRDE